MQDFSGFLMVPQERLELSRLSAPASKTGVSTIPPPGLKKLLKNLEAFLLFGSSTWARTRDLRINSPALYRLSYRGIDKDYSLIFERCQILYGFDLISLLSHLCHKENASDYLCSDKLYKFTYYVKCLYDLCMVRTFKKPH